MSKFRKFREYLDKSGKLQEKPINSDDMDTGPTPEKYPPAPATSGKNWKVTTPQDKAKAYVGVGTDPGQPKYDKGFSSEGDKKLVYEPKVGKPEKEGGKKLDSWPKGKTEAFLDDTRELTLAEFAHYVSEQGKVNNAGLSTITAYKTGSICPDPIQAMRYVATLAAANDRLMESLVIMLKSQGGLDKFLREAANHSDTYNELAFMLADPKNGGTVAHRLVKALSEVTVGETVDEPYEKPGGKKPKQPLQPNPLGPPAAEMPVPNEPPPPNGPPEQQVAKPRPTKSIAGNPMPGPDTTGIGQTMGGAYPPQQPEHNLVVALMAKHMI